MIIRKNSRQNFRRTKLSRKSRRLLAARVAAARKALKAVEQIRAKSRRRWRRRTSFWAKSRDDNLRRADRGEARVFDEPFQILTVDRHSINRSGFFTDSLA